MKAPTEELLADLQRSFGEGKIFRPYRDVRFSKDKTPYKTNIAATMEKGGYISLDADHFSVGTGYYLMARDQLARFRAAIVDDTVGATLDETVNRLRGKGLEVTAHDTLTTAPRGFDKDHPRIELLRMKGCIAWQQWEIDAWVGTAEPKERVRSFLKTAKPLVDWLDAEVGPTELEDERRR